MMSPIIRRLEKLESVAPPDAPRYLTEAEWDELSYDEMLAYLRGQLNIRLISEDDGASWEEFLVAAGVSPAEREAARAGGKASPALLDAHRRYMDGRMERAAARRAARRQAAEAPPAGGLT